MYKVRSQKQNVVIGVLTWLIISILFVYDSAEAQVRLFQEDGGSNYVGFRGPNTIATSLLWTLPATDGSANMCLATDGAGHLTWRAVSSSSGDFMANGSVPMSGALLGFSGTASLPGYTWSGDTATGFWRPAASTVAVSTAGTERMRIDSTGNVGIATASPAFKLDVVGDMKIGNAFTYPSTPAGFPALTRFGSSMLREAMNDGTGNFNQYLNAYYDSAAGAHKYGVSAAANRMTTSAGTFAFYVAPTGTSGNNITWTPALYMDNAAQVGIGNSAPTSSLDVTGVALAGDSAGAATGSTAFGIRYNGANVVNTIGSVYSSIATSVGYAVKPASGSAGFVSSAGNASFSRGSLQVSDKLVYGNAAAATVAVGSPVTLTDRFVVDSNGNVGVGVSVPSSLLHVNGTIRATQVCDQAGANCKTPSSMLSAEADTLATVTGRGATTTAVTYFTSNKGASSILGAASSAYSLEAYSSDLGAAAMSFHRGGAYAVNMGLDPDNVFRIGGYSAPSNRLQLDMSGNLTIPGSFTAGGNLILTAANPVITSGSSYIQIPNGLYVSGGTPYFANQIQARGGVHNDTAAYLTIAGGTNNDTYFSGDVGIGTSTPESKLDIYGGGSLSTVSGTVISYKDLAQYSGSPTTGTMKITLPKSWSNTMMRVTIRGYDYTSNGSWEVIVSGYNYAPGPNWVGYTAQVDGSAPFSQVRLGHDGTKNVILLGTTTTNWNYPQINISEFSAGYSAQTGWSTGWTIAPIVSEAGIGSLVTVPITGWLSQSNGASISISGSNVGIGTTSPGSLLHVNGVIRATQICDTAGANCKTPASMMTAEADTLASVVARGASTASAISTGGLAIATGGGLSMGGNTVIDADGGWHRSYGNTGWFNGTYSGGWYMSDTNYIRNYNSKSVSLSGGLYVRGVNPTDGAYAINAAPSVVGGGGVIGYTQNGATYGILGFNNTYTLYGNGPITVSGNISTAGSFTGSGSGLTGTAASLTAGDATNLGGFAASAYARLGQAVNFGNVAVTFLNSSSNLQTSGCLVYNGGTLGTCVSDARLKKDIRPFEMGLDDLLSLKPVTYRYNGLGNMTEDTKDRVGFLAQQVEETNPELIEKTKMKIHPDDAEDTEISQVKYGALTYMLINAIKELHSMFQGEVAATEVMSKEMASLREENEMLKKRLTEQELKTQEILRRLDQGKK